MEKTCRISNFEKLYLLHDFFRTKLTARFTLLIIIEEVGQNIVVSAALLLKIQKKFRYNDNITIMR